MAGQQEHHPWEGVLILETLVPLCMGVIASATSLAGPPPRDPIPPTTNIYNYKFGAGDDGNPPASSPAAPKSAAHAAEGSDEMGPHDCRTLSDNVQVCEPPHKGGKARKVSPGELALEKWARMPIPAPVVRTAPPRGSDGLVGLPEWFWVTNGHSRSGRVAARGVWVEVTAHLQSTTIAPGYGRPVVRCPGPGTAYDKSRPAAAQHTNCSYTFQQSSLYEPGHAYRVRVSATWGGTWRGSDGSGGALPPLTRSTVFRLRVAEAQSLYGRGGS